MCLQHVQELQHGPRARNGLAAGIACSAQFHEFSERALEARRLLNVLATRRDASRSRAPRSTWSWRKTPTSRTRGRRDSSVLDACLDLRAAHRSIRRRLSSPGTISPLALQLCGNKTQPTARRQAEPLSSAWVDCSTAMRVNQYTDARGERLASRRVPRPITLAGTPRSARKQARGTYHLADGARHERFVEHARGSLNAR